MFQFLVYKHMKIGNQAQLCLAIYNFEPIIMLSVCLTFQNIKDYVEY